MILFFIRKLYLMGNAVYGVKQIKVEKIFKKLLTNVKFRRIMCNNKFAKGGVVMFVNKFFYYFNMGCPSFVKNEK